jgi:chromosomal replication initiation ATPase DnaA
MTPLDYAAKIAASAGYTLDDILGYGRTQTLCDVRHEAWSVYRDTLGLSWNELQNLFNRDHGTIISGVRAYRRRRGL